MTSSAFPRLFTVNEANALIPTLRPLLDRISENLETLRARSEAVIRRDGLNPDTPDLMNRLQQDEEIAGLVQQIKRYVDEIHSYGCVCKGVEHGLVDFPCQFAGEIVFLCWQRREESIGYWHQIEDGFAGRRPLLDPGETGSTGTGSCH
jgi:hypothetical protein